MLGIQSAKELRKKYFLMILIFACVLFIGVLVFFYSVGVGVDNNSKKNIMTNIERQSEHFYSFLNIQYDYLESVAMKIGENDDLLCDDNMSMLTYMAENTQLDKTAVIDKKGDSYYNDGTVKNVAKRRYFKEVIAGRRTLSNPISSVVDGETKVVLSVPVFNKNKEIIGALGGSYDVGALSHVLFDDIYDGEGYSLILTEEGDIITYDNSNGEKKIESYENIFKYYDKINALNEIDKAKMMKDFKNQKSGYLSMKEGGKTVNYMAYIPIKLNNWMLCYIIPRDKARESYSFINDSEFMLLAIIIVALIILLVEIRKINDDSQKKILRLAEIDNLTGILNRRTTRESIKEYLKVEKKSAAFIMLDIDMFKEINDNFGHTVGDMALKRVGELLKNSFRKDDVVGRIGGDEFVVFMRNIQNDNEAIDRVKQLCEDFKKIEIKELQDRKLSCSVGISFCRDNKITFDELYRMADEALYETKKNGRDGYTIAK